MLGRTHRPYAVPAKAERSMEGLALVRIADPRKFPVDRAKCRSSRRCAALVASASQPT